MNYRPSKRVVWLTVPLVPVAVMCVALWLTDRHHTEAIAKRGSLAPVTQEFSAVDPSTWSVSTGGGSLIGEGMESMMTWEHNPWRRHPVHFGDRFRALMGDREEFERVIKLGREWHDRILARYPELAIPEAKAMPPEKNGLLKLNTLLTRLRQPGGLLNVPLTEGIPRPLGKIDLTDIATSRQLITTHSELIRELWEISRFTEGSRAGIDLQQLRSNRYWEADVISTLLLSDARVAAADGDVMRALDSIRAAAVMHRHLDRIPHSSRIRDSLGYDLWMTSAVTTWILPVLAPDQIDLDAWEAAINHRPRPASDFALDIRVQWSGQLTGWLLPASSVTGDVSVPHDIDMVIEAYTRRMRDLAVRMDSLKPGDAVSELPGISLSHLSERGQKVAAGMALNQPSGLLQDRWAQSQTNAGMTAAVFAILRGQPVPPDPVSGKPYTWDPENRVLSPPATNVINKSTRFQITLPPSIR